jgi:MFS family permease
MTDTLARTHRVEPPTRSLRRSPGLVALFASTAFLGAGLLFVVQPMVARLVLPSFGGSATVWSTSSLFFQLLLLVGYVYAHATTRRLGRRWQPPAHLLTLLAPLVVLPIALPSGATPSSDVSAELWLLRVLTLMIGLPFFVIATTGPLLQRWYSWSEGPRADDPYFLFAASNLGSFAGLLAYPLLVEPFLTLEQQRGGWSLGFVLFVTLMVACGFTTRGSRPPRPAVVVDESRARWTMQPLDLLTIGRWVVLAFLPSGLMLAVTAHISTDIAAIPLLWVLPLGIYLATFVVAFARTSRVVPTIAVRVAVASTFLAAAAALLHAATPVLLAVGINMAMLGSVAFVAHARLATERPEVGHLTSFYLIIAAGGALGGLLNGLIAPIVFDRVVEYQFLVVLVPLVIVVPRVAAEGEVRETIRSVTKRPLTRIAAVAIAVPVTVLMATRLEGWADGLAVVLLALGLALLSGWLLSSRRVVPALVLALVFAGLSVYADREVLEYRRTFFGSYRVLASGEQHSLAHGTTLHGTQWLDERRDEPTTYYSLSGPLGSVFAMDGISDVGVVGLGVGTIAAYGTPERAFNFIEIDPEIVEIARDPSLFTYLRDSQAQITTTVGDGRLEISKLTEGSLDMVLLDAFSSDSIPIHLLTVDAMRTYSDRLRPGGLLVVHISNRVLDLAPVLSGSAEELGWPGRVAIGGTGAGATPSRWVVLSADDARLDKLQGATEWKPLPKRTVTWTDDYSSILSVLQ